MWGLLETSVSLQWVDKYRSQTISLPNLKAIQSLLHMKDGWPGPFPFIPARAVEEIQQSICACWTCIRELYNKVWSLPPNPLALRALVESYGGST